MREMRVKRVRRKCGVRGCKNIDSFTITRVNEAGNSIIICRSCLYDALRAVDNYNDGRTKAKTVTAPPPLFFSGRDRVLPDDGKVKPEENTGLTDEECICPICGKTFKNSAGLKSHMRTHEAVDSK